LAAVDFANGRSLRLYHLTTMPPGLTHDEADHGITAVAILNGAREIYFTVGHGREPLFDYATAGLMALLGQKGVGAAGNGRSLQPAHDRGHDRLDAPGL
jgi:hypothetical protein